MTGVTTAGKATIAARIAASDGAGPSLDSRR